MERLKYRLLVVSFHCLVVFGNYCNSINEYKLKRIYQCLQDNYHCPNYYEQGVTQSIYTCFNVENLRVVYQEIGNSNGYNNLVIKNSSIPTLRQEGNSWNNIQELRIEDTNTHKIIPGFFNSFDDLRELCITKNKIKTISDGVFSSMIELQSLNLTENLIETVAGHSFSGLFNLRILDLSKNRIRSLPENIFDYQNYLLYVDISRNMLKNVGSIFNKSSLTTINVSRNVLSDFDFNQLQNSKITVLDLSNNLFDNVTAIDKVLDIANISLACNKISVLPKLGNIKALNISHNIIQSIDTSALGKSLQSLDVTGNNISLLNNKLFTNATNLEFLYLAHNNLTSLENDALHNLYNLKYLDLSFNQIRQIPFGFFNDLKELTYLDLSDNNMILEFHTLTTLKSLQSLKFSNNKVKNFDVNILLDRFKFLKSITLSDYSWNCTELASIIHQLELRHINLTSGQNRDVSNVLGVSCKDNIDLKEDTILIERNNEPSKDAQFYPSAEKIDNILGNTTFFKYLQIIANHISENKSMPDSLDYRQSTHENFTNTNKFIKATLNSLNDMQEYMRKIYNNTNYFQYYLNSSKSADTNNSRYLGEVQQVKGWSEILKQSIMDFTKNITSWQNKSLNEISNNLKESPMAKNISWSEIFNQTLNNLTNSFKEISNNMKKVVSFISSVQVDKNIESKALISENHGEIRETNNSLIYIDILLTMILCCLIFFAYRNFFKAKIIASTAQEQVQLM